MHDSPWRAAAFAVGLLAIIHAPTALAAPAHDTVERAVLTELSKKRAKVGAPRLRPSGALHRIADRHSRAMARSGRLDHGAWEERIGSVARGRAGETIAVVPSSGRRLVRRAVAGWMSSPPHRAILLDPRLKHIGIARRPSHRGWFLTADVVQRLR